MSVIINTDNGWLLDHKMCSHVMYLFANDALKAFIECKSDNGSVCFNESLKLKFSDKFFKINAPFMMDTEFMKLARSKNSDITDASGKPCLKRSRRKRNVSRNRVDSYHETIKEHIQLATDDILELEKGFFIREAMISLDNNREARFAASLLRAHGDRLSELNDWPNAASSELKFLTLDGSMSLRRSLVNTYVRYEGKDPCILSFKGNGKEHRQYYVVPPKCSFIMSEVAVLSDFAATGKQFDLIVLDPPWPNKSVKRKKGYWMLGKEEIVNIPVKSLARTGALIAVWTTNNRFWMDFVRHELFPSWNVRFCAEWHWLKLTTAGKPVCDLESCHKKPYEHLIVGQRLGCNDGLLLNLQNHRVICSVPSSIHSHKPPLAELFEPYLRDGRDCLELFSRCLLPGWTSWGNEVLLLQHLDLYESWPH